MEQQERYFNKNYRKDNRSREEFEEDIKEFTQSELQLMNTFQQLIANQIGIDLEIHDNEGDRGEKVEVDQVDNQPDFQISKDIEVKECRPDQQKFHLKKHQLEKYRETDCVILFFMGTKTEEPLYAVIEPGQALEKGEDTKWFGGKDSVRLKVHQFEFRYLKTGNKLEEDYSECEKEGCQTQTKNEFCSFECMNQGDL